MKQPCQSNIDTQEMIVWRVPCVLNVKMKNKHMKAIRILTILALFVAFGHTAQAQTTGVPNEVVEALKVGDSNKLSAYLNNNVELVIGKTNDVYSKQQAVGIIADFFRKNTVSGFNVLHSGNKEAASFIIGLLKTSTGNYRVYVLTRKTGGKTLIQQLRIETE